MAFGEALGHLASNHVADQFFSGQILGGLRRNDLTIAQNSDRIGDTEELFELVGNVNAGHPVFLEGVQNFHKLFGFGGGQRAGRLIQNQHLSILRERFGNLGHLHFANAQGLNNRLGLDIQTVFLQKITGLGVESIPVDRPALSRFLTQENVFTNRQLRHQREFLVHGGDALFGRLTD